MSCSCWLYMETCLVQFHKWRLKTNYVFNTRTNVINFKSQTDRWTHRIKGPIISKLLIPFAFWNSSKQYLYHDTLFPFCKEFEITFLERANLITRKTYNFLWTQKSLLASWLQIKKVAAKNPPSPRFLPSINLILDDLSQHNLWQMMIYFIT